MTAAALADGDTATVTGLERAYLPNDAHSFTKYYDGDDLEPPDPVQLHRDLDRDDAVASIGMPRTTASVDANEK